MVNKAEFIKELAEKTGKSKAETERFINDFQETVVEKVVAGEEVRLSNFMSFKPVVRAARTARNPQTGASMEIPETKAVKASPLKGFRDAVKGS